MRERRHEGADEAVEARPAHEPDRPPLSFGALGELSAGSVLHLQRTAGNHAVAAALLRGGAQDQRAAPGAPASLRVLDRLRIARVTSWGGEWKTRRYKTLKDGSGTPLGVDIEIDFMPNDKVDASSIGIVQTATTTVAGAMHPGLNAERQARAIKSGPNTGMAIDQLAGFVNPLYATTAGAAGDTLGSTGVLAANQPGGGRHGWRTVDTSGTEHKRSARMNDQPQIPTATNDSRQEFETTAIAVSGKQQGTYYGSVHWGWRRDATGKFRRLPFTLQRDDAPSASFNTAAGLWNTTKTGAGVAHVRLPTAVGRWVSVPDSPVVEDPGATTPTELAKLDEKTRVEVTTRGTGRPFNAGPAKWWKITAVSDAHIGLVGWTLSSNLTATRPAP